jgi:small-conductance mechanosensitive channel
MSQTDKILVIAALILGVLDVLNIRNPLSRLSAAGIAIVLLAVVELHRGGVFSY